MSSKRRSVPPAAPAGVDGVGPVLDPAIREVGETIAVGEYPLELSTQQFHEGIVGALKQISPPLPEGVVRTEFSIDTDLNKKGKIPLTLYTNTTNAVSRPLPVLLYFHGGAFIVGSPATHDTIQANLCLSSGCAVLSVDYSLAPEELYPTPYKEGHQVLQWVQQHGHEKHNLDGKNVSVIGDSAGGNAACGVTQLCIKHGTPLPSSLIMMYPVVDYSKESWSYQLWPGQLGLGTSLMRVSASIYAPDYRSRLEPLMSPVLAADEDLKKFPETVIVIAELDILRGETEAFGRRLLGLGVKTYMSMTYGGIHDYTLYPLLSGTGAYAGTVDLVAGHARRTLLS